MSRQTKTPVAAAAGLGVDQATVARRLRTLEQELATSLFTRHPEGYSLTAAGGAFAGHDLVMFPRDVLPQYWQELCGEPLTNGNIVMETASQLLLIEAVRQGMGISMMAREIVERCCPELINVMPSRSDSADIWLVVNPEVWTSGRVRVVIEAINDAFAGADTESGR
ncbi:LysR family transcriptional regulator [Acerihabitans arboris]|uniref:LysR family transcriptional regulator n=1 Tax=Acerihabitans arboris TaxID=2691583 RepID=A0A845SNH5_9GAMM|nr:LysR family transcriptional regulator [Acerihabitans arboris]NDL64757.1 LysR family transcriptional regulator [Acerihabitans arboris]